MARKNALCLALALGLHAPLVADGLSARAPVKAFESRVVEAARSAIPAFVFIGGGSGIAIRSDGYVLTNHHVVASGRRWLVRMPGGKGYRAEVVGKDPLGDVALLKLNLKEGETIPAIELGDSDGLRVGDPVLALGNPFLLGSENPFHFTPANYQPTISLGFVSAVHRYRGGYSDAIQTDGSINPGNSGGPLLDLNGRIVGINGQIETRFQNRVNTGVGFAIPAEQIRRFLPKLMAAEGGTVRHGEVRGLEISLERTDGRGARVRDVDPGSPADRAGFRSDDVIVGIDETPITSPIRFLGALGTYPEGHEVRFRLLRGEEEAQISVALDPVRSRSRRQRPDPDAPYLGVLLGEADDGVRIDHVVPETPAARAGFELGDVIVVISGQRMRTVAEVKERIARHRPGDSIEIEVRRGDASQKIEVTLARRGD